MKKVALVAVAVAAVTSASSFAATTGPDMTALTSNIDFSTVTPAILSIAGLLAVVYVATKGAKLVLSMVKRG